MYSEDKRSFLSNFGTSKHLDELLSNPLSARNLWDIIENPSFKSDHIDKFINNKNVSGKIIAAGHLNLEPRHYEQLIQEKDWKIRDELATNQNIPKEHLEKLTKDEHYVVASTAKEQLEKRFPE